jgi:hypothetical protein
MGMSYVFEDQEFGENSTRNCSSSEKESYSQIYPRKLYECITKGLARQLRRDIEILREGARRMVPPEAPVFHLELIDDDEAELDLNHVDEIEEAFDDVKGGSLDARLVREARLKELKILWEREVYQYADVGEAQQKRKQLIGLKWIDTNKGDEVSPNVRSTVFVSVELPLRRRTGRLRAPTRSSAL